MISIIIVFIGVFCLSKSAYVVNRGSLEYLQPMLPYGDIQNGYLPLWHSITYDKIDKLGKNTFLRVRDFKFNKQNWIKIYVDKNIPTILNQLTRTVYMVYTDNNNKISVARLYHDGTDKKFVVQNYASTTKWSLVTGDSKGNIDFTDYSQGSGIHNLTRYKKVSVTLQPDNFGNVVFDAFEGSEMYFYPILNDVNTGLPIVYDPLTGEGLLVQRKSSDTDLRLYNLEYDTSGNYRAVDLQYGTRFNTGVGADGKVVFSTKPVPKPLLKTTPLVNTICKNLPLNQVKYMFDQSILTDNKGASFVMSVDTLLNTKYLFPIEFLDNLPIVNDFITSWAYLVYDTTMTQLFKDKKNYVIKDFASKTGYSIVKVDKKKKLSFKPYNPKNLENITRTYDTAMLPEENINQLVTIQYSGEKRDQDVVRLQFVVSRDPLNNNPLIYNPLTCETMLVSVYEPQLYRLERNDGKLVTINPYTYVRRPFKLDEKQNVDIIFT
uniref:Dipeptidylpeptidase IV N-terminal domain-containing protein n=1 Tax=Clastoptera arizonana TaxID=38151 RepID=A0A1B6CPX3_9HEMI